MLAASDALDTFRDAILVVPLASFPDGILRLALGNLLEAIFFVAVENFLDGIFAINILVVCCCREMKSRWQLEIKRTAVW